MNLKSICYLTTFVFALYQLSTPCIYAGEESKLKNNTGKPKTEYHYILNLTSTKINTLYKKNDTKETLNLNMCVEVNYSNKSFLITKYESFSVTNGKETHRVAFKSPVRIFPDKLVEDDNNNELEIIKRTEIRKLLNELFFITPEKLNNKPAESTGELFGFEILFINKYTTQNGFIQVKSEGTARYDSCTTHDVDNDEYIKDKILEMMPVIRVNRSLDISNNILKSLQCTYRYKSKSDYFDSTINEINIESCEDNH